MGHTSIEWTDVTWNPVRGCSRVSEGCRNCYAERQAARFAKAAPLGEPETTGNRKGPFAGFVHIINGHPAWTGKVELVENHLYDPISWRKPRRVFVNSMSDLFHEALSNETLDRIFEVMASCPQHTFQILTKRPGRMLEYVLRLSILRMAKFKNEDDLAKWAAYEDYTDGTRFLYRRPWPIPNIHLGVSVENQHEAVRRTEYLREVPAAIRFISQEPQLEFIDWNSGMLDGIDQVIQGGESGPKSRPFNIDWVYSTQKQCQDANVAYFLKQVGACLIFTGGFDPRKWPVGTKWVPNSGGVTRLFLRDKKGGDMDEWPHDIRIREFPQFQTGAVR